MTGRPAGCSLHRHPTYDEYLRCRFGDTEARHISIRLAQRDLPNPDRRPRMTDTVAKLASKTLDAEAGVRSEDAERFHKQRGARRMAIVELESFRFTEELDKGDVVTLQVTSLELVPEGSPEDFVRDYQRAIYMERSPKPLDGDLQAETVDDATARGRAKLLCEVCLHQRSDDRISHEPDPDRDGAFCTWRETGEEVELDEEPADANA